MIKAASNLNYSISIINDVIHTKQTKKVKEISATEGEIEKTITDMFPAPSDIVEKIQNEFINVQKEYNDTEYQRLRKAEYAKLNQDEMRFDDEMNGTTTWIDAILEIKNKYPKPEKD